MMKKSVIFVLLVYWLSWVACSGPAGSVGQPASGSSNQNEIVLPAPATGIQAVQVKLQSLPDTLEIPAQVLPDPRRVVRVYPPVGGRLISMEVKPGDHVRSGQVLATLESTDVTTARSDYQKAMVDLDLKGKAKDRAALLYDHKAISLKDYQQAVADFEVSQSEFNAARARMQLLRIDPRSASNEFSVTAPRAGVVLDIGAASGEFSKSLDAPTPMATLADLGTVWVVGDVYVENLAFVKPGTPTEVSTPAYPGQVWSGTISALSDAADPVTRTLKVRVTLANPGEKLKPQLFASIQVMRPGASGLIVPESAVLHEGTFAYLFVQKSPGHFERRVVALGRTVKSGVVVETGLNAGEWVVTEGALLLREASDAHP